ncbi:MAG: hypothetical protein WC510_05560 [Candidatus Omnitrophota bacterium]
MNRATIKLKILGSLLIICATFIATVVVVSFDKKMSDINKEITNFYDTRIITMLAVLSYEDRETLPVVQEVEYYQMLIHEHQLKNKISIKEKSEEKIKELEKAKQKTLETILNNNIFLAKRWSTLLGKDRKGDEDTRATIDKIQNDKNLNVMQKLDKVRELQDKNKKMFGDRLLEIQNKWLKNVETKEHLDNGRLFWQMVFVWMQIGGLSMLAFAEVIEGLSKNKKQE